MLLIFLLRGRSHHADYAPWFSEEASDRFAASGGPRLSPLRARNLEIRRASDATLPYRRTEWIVSETVTRSLAALSPCVRSHAVKPRRARRQRAAPREALSQDGPALPQAPGGNRTSPPTGNQGRPSLRPRRLRAKAFGSPPVSARRQGIPPARRTQSESAIVVTTAPPRPPSAWGAALARPVLPPRP